MLAWGLKIRDVYGSKELSVCSLLRPGIIGGGCILLFQTCSRGEKRNQKDREEAAVLPFNPRWVPEIGSAVRQA